MKLRNINKIQHFCVKSIGYSTSYKAYYIDVVKFRHLEDAKEYVEKRDNLCGYNGFIECVFKDFTEGQRRNIVYVYCNKRNRWYKEYKTPNFSSHFHGAKKYTMPRWAKLDYVTDIKRERIMDMLNYSDESLEDYTKIYNKLIKTFPKANVKRFQNVCEDLEPFYKEKTRNIDFTDLQDSLEWFNSFMYRKLDYHTTQYVIIRMFNELLKIHG